MSILLDTPYRGYAEVKIVEIRLRIQRRNLFLLFQYGETVGGRWIAGDLVPDERLVANVEQLVDGESEIRAADPIYDVLVASSKAAARDVAAAGDGGFNCYAGTARNLYRHAIDSGWYKGSIQ